MTLKISIQTGGRDLASPAELALDRNTAVIGRAAGCDWVLSDPTRHVSSRHCEIRFEGEHYTLTDISTNGTFLARTGERLSGRHIIVDGDAFTIGPFTVLARLTGAGASAGREATAAPWRGWDSDGGEADRPIVGGWDQPPAGDGGAGWDPPARSGAGGGWHPTTGPSLARPEAHRAADAWNAPSADRADPDRERHAPWEARAMPTGGTVSTWDTAMPPPDPASNWSSAAPDRPPALTPDALWGQIAEGNVVDWARGGFGQPVDAPRDPLGLDRREPAEPAPVAPPPAPATRAAPPQAREAGAPSPGSDAFVAALGVDASRLGDTRGVAQLGGTLFRKLIAGLVVMLEARARAKAQLGAENTAFSPDGHNPLKFARTPDEAVAMLVGPPQIGFMPADRAIEDAFEDLQSHQVATLKAMQGALRTTLERFSPSAIKGRAKSDGLLERVIPAARDAALWQAYEREFGGVAEGSDEAFLDMFAKEFRNAYNEQARARRG